MTKKEIIENLKNVRLSCHPNLLDWDRESSLYNVLITRIKWYRSNWTKLEFENFYKRALKAKYIWENRTNLKVQKFIDEIVLIQHWCYDEHIDTLYDELIINDKNIL